MDPLTQGALGAALPQATWAKSLGKHRYQLAIAGFIGMLGGMAADLDILIASDSDPLLFLTYHRQFTHSLIFIPIGGLLVALVLHGLLRRRWHLSFRQTMLFCSLGYATHALLDCATSYGTMLLWPFVETRYSWSIVSIVDPLFTLPLLASVVMAAVQSDPRPARIGLVWALLYLAAGWAQHQDARAMAAALAVSRGHAPVRFEIKPSFGNIVVWKSIYEADGRFYVDALRVRLAPRVYEGTSVVKLDAGRDFPWLDPATQQARDIARFNRFSDGFSAPDPATPNRIVDVRYSFVPNEISALFSIELDPAAAPAQHVKYRTHREQAREQIGRLWRLIAG
ncbi:metal-dependent hydrolase [Thalassospiraceae bacterium LMO-JJ14]|nr:metal-dependent hydrolase [Thalassospiraceae bacterium LMO-JJ14]